MVDCLANTGATPWPAILLAAFLLVCGVAAVALLRSRNGRGAIGAAGLILVLVVGSTLAGAPAPATASSCAQGDPESVGAGTPVPDPSVTPRPTTDPVDPAEPAMVISGADPICGTLNALLPVEGDDPDDVYFDFLDAVSAHAPAPVQGAVAVIHPAVVADNEQAAPGSPRSEAPVVAAQDTLDAYLADTCTWTPSVGRSNAGTHAIHTTFFVRDRASLTTDWSIEMHVSWSNCVDWDTTIHDGAPYSVFDGKRQLTQNDVWDNRDDGGFSVRYVLQVKKSGSCAFELTQLDYNYTLRNPTGLIHAQGTNHWDSGELWVGALADGHCYPGRVGYCLRTDHRPSEFPRTEFLHSETYDIGFLIT